MCLLSTEIVVNPAAPLVFHSESDNFVQFFNMLEGQGSVHAAHRMMLQDTEGEQRGKAQLVLLSMVFEAHSATLILGSSLGSVKDA